MKVVETGLKLYTYGWEGDFGPVYRQKLAYGDEPVEGPEVIVEGPGLQKQPQLWVAGDDEHLIYVSDQSGHPEVWAKNLPKSGY